MMGNNELIDGPSKRGRKRTMSRWHLLKSKILPSCMQHRFKMDDNEKRLPSSGNPSQVGFAASSLSPSLPVQLNISPHLRRFTFDELMIATNTFHRNLLLGEGGFGKVHKGWVFERGSSARIQVAVKSLKPHSVQGHREWQNEVDFLRDIHHPNIVKLLGYCIEGEKRALVYEYLDRGSLNNKLFRRIGQTNLQWRLRMNIALDVAKGLAFLHDEAARPVIFRDLKTSNILLDRDYNAKISDFGLALDAPRGNSSHVLTSLMGTPGYADPNYELTGCLSIKSDVYSFGVVLTELLTGQRSLDATRPRGQQDLVQRARPYLKNRERCQRIVDPALHGQFSVTAMIKSAQVAYNCTHRDPKRRPLMSQVVKALEPLPELMDIAIVRPYHQSSPVFVQRNVQLAQSPIVARTSSASPFFNNSARPRFSTPQHP